MAAPEILPPDQAVSLFYNGHRIARSSDPPSKWVAMSRSGVGGPVLLTPMPPGMEQALRDGQYYLVEGAVEPPPPPVQPPVNVDVPQVSANGVNVNCTMGNWENMQEEPHSYAYAWQRDGEPIEDATSADYIMGADDSGQEIGCIVTATNSGGSTAAPLSNTVLGPTKSRKR